MKTATPERWHVTQLANGEIVAHHVYTDYDYAMTQIRHKGLWGGTNVLVRSTTCNCQRTLT